MPLIPFVLGSLAGSLIFILLGFLLRFKNCRLLHLLILLWFLQLGWDFVIYSEHAFNFFKMGFASYLTGSIVKAVLQYKKYKHPITFWKSWDLVLGVLMLIIFSMLYQKPMW